MVLDPLFDNWFGYVLAERGQNHNRSEPLILSLELATSSRTVTNNNWPEKKTELRFLCFFSSDVKKPNFSTTNSPLYTTLSRKRVCCRGRSGECLEG